MIIGFTVIPHFAGAAVALFVLARLAYFINGSCPEVAALRRPAMSALHLTGVQLILGSAAWIAKMRDVGKETASAAKVWLTTGHLALGALIFGCCVTAAWRVFKMTSESGQPAPAIQSSKP